MDDTIGQYYFYLPETYFVSVLSSIDEQIYKVQYSSFIGYAFADHLSIVSFTPIEPNLENVTFDILSKVGTQLWDSPSTSGTKLTNIAAGTTNIEYVASTTGEIPVGGTTNLWYYVRYTPATNSTQFYEGYIYSEAIENLSNIPNNLEVEISNDQPNLNSSISLETPLKIALIIMICIPFAVLICISIIKAAKQKQKKVEENTKKPAASYVRKIKKPVIKNDEPIEKLEVSFPQYDYIDDDDLL